MAGAVILGFASVFTLFALVLVAVSFSTDAWTTVTVNRSELKKLVKTASTTTFNNASLYNDRLYFSSGRGLFRTCYTPREETFFLDKPSDKFTVVDQNCIAEDGYNLDNNPKIATYSDEYKTRTHLLRLHFALFVCSILLLLVAVILGAVGCWNLSIRLLQFSSGMVFLAAFLIAGGMGVFHGYEYLEKTKIINDEPYFYAYWFTSPQYSEMKDNSYYSYGYSYILGWCGMGFAAIAAILYLCAASSVYTAMRDQDKRPLHHDSGSYREERHHKGYRNRAYDHMDRPYPDEMGYYRDGYYDARYPIQVVDYPAAGYYKY